MVKKIKNILKMKNYHKETCPNTFKNYPRDFPGGRVVKNLPANAGNMGLSSGPGRFHMLQSN